jgi:rSAM/selenodomain-associated transferase 2
MADQKISVVIPTLNEVSNIDKRLSFLANHECAPLLEVIVVDGGSSDGTLEVVKNYGGVRLVQSAVASRAVQMNIGAKTASHEILYFVHADVSLPNSFYTDIIKALATYQLGGYRYKFDSDFWLLKINSFFTRFSMDWCRGGDQTLFITRSLFEKLDGFDEHYCVMEDFDLIRRSKPLADYHIIPKYVIVSARKYDQNSYLRVQRANLSAFRMFRRGVDPQEIRTLYKSRLGLVDY